MQKVSLPLAISLVLVTFVVGLAGGYFISPAYQQTMNVKEAMGLGQADRFVDLRYINQMAAHHKGAILLANQVAQTSQRPEIKSLATEIQQNEPKLIAELFYWKQNWYNDHRPVKDPLVAKLGTYDEKLDLRFLNALIAHHQDGIEMTREIRTKSSRNDILNNADAVESFLTKSLETLKEWRSLWYQVN